MNIKETYGLSKKISWQGDPCAPQLYRWEGLNCSYPDSEASRIISLYVTYSLSQVSLVLVLSQNSNNYGYFSCFTNFRNLNGSELTGSITSDISKLTLLTVL